MAEQKSGSRAKESLTTIFTKFSRLKMNDETKQTVVETIEQTVEAAEEIVRHPYTKKFAEFGFYTKGFLFIVIGILALMVAFGVDGGELADPTGAMTIIAQFTYGKILLIIFIFGAASHGIWNILRGAADVDDAGKNWRGIIRRSVAVGTGIFYLFLAWTALRIITTANVTVQNGTFQKSLTAVVIAIPFGAIFIFIVGVSVVGVGFSQCYRGVTGKFQEDFRLYELTGGKRRIVGVLGALGFTARAVIFALIGYFFIIAAIDGDPNEARGIDGALRSLAYSYYGKSLLFVAAVGLICHGILSLYEARYRRIC
ncbi:MAG: DUF1206 domain-containing protein [Acidobacteriota bacterium]|nr:DUF1206 domain-containing protein [Acidobacteriota bacterium]